MKQTKRLSVLYAEDNEDSGVMLMTLLGLSDIDVWLARSVKEAFQSAQNKHFDLYLLDSIFPDGSGFDLCQKLREFTPQTPIVFYSGAAFETDKQKGLQAGADAYLIKPEVNTVTSTIFHLLAQTSEKDDGKMLPPRNNSNPHTEIPPDLNHYRNQPDFYDGQTGF